VKKPFLLALLLPALTLAIYDMKWFDLNHWKAPFYNDGRWGIDITIGQGQAGGSWPYPLHNCYVFGAGPWVGAITPSAETLCTFFYNPNSGGTEADPTLCRYWRDGYGDSLDRIYKYPGDWPPPASRFPMAPQDHRSDMDMWSCFGDSDPANHISPGHPLGIDVYLTVYGFADSLAQDFFFLKYELANSSGDSIRQAYFGMMLDPDIGDGTDDGAGLILDRLYQVDQDTIRVRNVGFAYDYDNVETHSAVWDSGTPGTVAIMLLQAPQHLGLAAFKRFTIDIDPLTDAAQYLTLAGFNYRTGAYEPYDSAQDYSPADVRMLLATGPLNLAPDSFLTFWYAVIGSPFGDSGQAPSQRDTSELAKRCKWARDFFGNFAGVAEQPSTPHILQPIATIVRGVLFLPPSLLSPPSSLLSIDGRKVIDLKPGANDVSRLSPGVYFVREEPQAGSHKLQVVRKIVIAR
jgi:hypothetical protein